MKSDDTVLNLHVIDLPNDYDCCYIVPISDTHIGDPLFNRKKLDGYLNWIKSEPKARIVLVGDIMNIALHDSPSNPFEATMTPQEELDTAREIFLPFKDKILAVTSGNHEMRIWKKTGLDVSKEFAKSLGVIYEPIAIALQIRVGKKNRTEDKQISYVLYLTHGWGGGKKIGSKANNLWSLAEKTLADVYVMSHNHWMLGFQDAFFVPDQHNHNYMKVKRTFAGSGAYLDWGGYAQSKGFSPSKLGSPRIRLAGDKKDVHVSI